MDKKNKIIFSVAVGAIAAVIFITAVTIGADLYLPLKGWLKNVFSHHWVGKGILSLAIFGVVCFFGWFLPIEPSEEKIRKILNLSNWLLILGTLAILGFFVWEALSVMIQGTSFKLFKRRVFLMSPFHHHLQLIHAVDSFITIKIKLFCCRAFSNKTSF